MDFRNLCYLTLALSLAGCAVGPYFIDANSNIRVIPWRQAPGHYTVPASRGHEDARAEQHRECRCRHPASFRCGAAGILDRSGPMECG